MADLRKQLPVGTQIRLANGSLYTVTGDAIGFGGGSIIYPAHRLVLQSGALVSDGFEYVVKECFPAAGHFRFVRDESGRILPECRDEEAIAYLNRARQMQLEEGAVSRAIYRTASRMLPIREASFTVRLQLPGREAQNTDNTVTVMESISEKGRSMTAWIRQRRQFAPGETFRILQQLLYSLREIHQSGYLHLDIQDGNVFLRGALGEETAGELVTLLDFGSARALEGGKTAPVRDRVIFTSRGFSAPEILLRNDGNLTLGPEADLYSVGCLALFLLTGQKPDPRQLLTGNTVFLKPNQIRRMKCPRHLTDSICRFLARALALAPEDRYHSAEEMLAAVTDLAEALQPYRTDLSNVAYDAFICYKHGQIDSAAALILQRQLEQFRAPRGISGSRKPFRRVFVDEGELSSCADFGLQIREALKNSGWLIVVCSPDTPLSPWVQLEIDTFLQYHDRSRILAVLTGGDEKNAFPPALRADAAGNGEILAADARGDSLGEVAKKLRGDALLKLAAPMLGTTFDTLKQRQKVYLLQRAAAVTAVFLALAVAFAGYALNRAAVIADQARQIEEEYRNSLLNESRFLAEQAEKRLAEQDPLGAMELALQALPSPEQDRPLLPRLEYTLGKALGIYTTPDSADNILSPVGVLDAQVPNFYPNDSGSRIFTWQDYADGRIQVWDGEALSLLGSLSSGGGYSITPVFADETCLILNNYDRLVSLDHRTGAENWSLDAQRILRAEISPDRQYVYALYGGASEFDSGLPEDQARPALLILSAETGTVLQKVSFTPGENQAADSRFCVSPDRKWAAVISYATDSADVLRRYHSVYLLDLQRETETLLFSSETGIAAMAFTHGKLALLRDNGLTLTTMNGKLPLSVIASQDQWFELYDPAAGTLVWSRQDHSYPVPVGLQEIHNAVSDSGEAALLYVVQNRCLLLRRSDGALLREYALQDAAMDLRLGSAGFETINVDGSRSRAYFTGEKVWHFQNPDQPVTEIFRRGDVLFLQSASYFSQDYTIRKYRLGKYDSGYEPLWTAEAGEADAWSLLDYRNTAEGVKVLLCSGSRICLADLTAGTSRIWDTPAGDPFSEYNMLSLSAQADALYWEGSYVGQSEQHLASRRVYRTDLRTGETKELASPAMPKDVIYMTMLGTHQEQIYYAGSILQESGTTWQVHAWDLKTGQVSMLLSCDVPEGLQYQHSSLIPGTEPGQFFFLLSEEYTNIPRELVRRETDGSLTRIPLAFTPDPGEDSFPWISNSLRWDDSGDCAVFGFGNTLYAVDRSGNLLFSIPLKSDPAALEFSSDGKHLYLACTDGTLSQYRLPDGACMETLFLEEETALYFYAPDADFVWLGDSTLGIFGGYVGFLVDLSGETMTMKAVIDHCFGYDPAGNRFLTIDSISSATAMGSFPRYSVEDLRQMAIALLN